MIHYVGLVRATLRPMLEERVNSDTKTPVAWTISNRWMQWGVPVLEWAFAQGRATGLDSFLMGALRPVLSSTVDVHSGVDFL